MSIGQGALPAPDSVDVAISGWVVLGATVADATNFYDLHDDNGTAVWLQQNARIRRHDDPVLTAGGGVSTLAEFVASGGSESTDTLAVVLARGNTTTRDIEITDFTRGVILTSPNGSRKRLTVQDDGTVTTTPL